MQFRVIRCRNNGRKGNHTESHCRERPMCRSGAWQIQPVRTTGTIYRHVIPSAVKRSRGIYPSSRFYLVVVHYPTWWIPPLRLRYGRNDIWVTFLRIRPLFLECFMLPRPSSVRAAPCQLPRGGSFRTGLWGNGIVENGSVLSGRNGT